MLNNVTIQGNLTRDPEIRYLEPDKVVTQGAIAHNTRVNGQDRTCYLEFSIWGRQAEAVANHFKKGNQIILEGQLAQDFWQDRHTGQQRSKHVLKATRFHFCGSKSQAPAQQQPPVVTTTVPLGASQTAPMVPPAAVGAPIAPMAAPGAQVPVTAQQAATHTQVAPVAATHTVVAPSQPTTTAPGAQPAATTPAAVPEQPQTVLPV